MSKRYLNLGNSHDSNSEFMLRLSLLLIPNAIRPIQICLNCGMRFNEKHLEGNRICCQGLTKCLHDAPTLSCCGDMYLVTIDKLEIGEI